MVDQHTHALANCGRAFAIGVALNLTFVAVEGVYGVLSGSLALVADAGHNLSDVLGLLLAWGASVLARRQPTERRTYGMRRASILAALANAVILLVALGGIAWEAIGRFAEPQPVPSTTIIWVAALGVVINAATAALFFAGQHGDINIRGAFLHMIADAGVSLGVVLAGVAILLTGWQWIDPAISLLIAAIVFASTWGLLRDSANLALDAVPGDIDLAQVRAYLEQQPEVLSAHDLHVWAMSTTETALTAHVVVRQPLRDNTLIERICRDLHDRFAIVHSTVQVEVGAPADECRVEARRPV